MRDTTIEVSGLRKRFGPVVALDGMTFTVSPGQITGFIGPNEAGKPNIGIRHFFVTRTGDHQNRRPGVVASFGRA